MSTQDHDSSRAMMEQVFSVAGTIPERALMVGTWLGRGIFTSTLFGIVGGHLGVFTFGCGPVIPFAVGSWLGFTASLLWSYKSLQRLMSGQGRPLYFADPVHSDTASGGYIVIATVEGDLAVLELRLANSSFHLVDWEGFMKGLESSWVKTGWAITAMYSIRPAIKELEERKIAGVTEEYAAV
ncbi:hypothetical protein FOL47_007583 [Perkinsus chesapeaki]|uniref:Uncharacterized protein n=1 Tax=Perkinsus chesapeaki TaxID=330153 RepID=A0A7J6LJJ2_PERCH|nr:hypothetical protein FOL47_007583 [Perkinsus chesapeaki]